MKRARHTSRAAMALRMTPAAHKSAAALAQYALALDVAAGAQALVRRTERRVSREMRRNHHRPDFRRSK